MTASSFTTCFYFYQPPFYKGQQGALGHILGGWTLASIFTAGSGLPITLGTVNGGGQAFGEGDSVNFFGNGNSENAIPTGHISTGVHYTPARCPSLFADDTAAFNQIRQPILGLDSKDGGWGVLRGLPDWSLDLSIKKNLPKLRSGSGNFEFQTVIINALNHAIFDDPGPGDYLDTSAGPDGLARCQSRATLRGPWSLACG